MRACMMGAGAGLAMVLALQGCSEKTVTAPAAIKPAPVVAAAPAPVVAAMEEEPEPEMRAPKSHIRKANLQCAGRQINVTATCMDLDDSGKLSCTAQRFAVSDSIEGKELHARVFEPGKASDNNVGTIDAEYHEISCVTAKSSEKYIVAYMNRAGGGNCKECEWVDVYTWDGELLGNEDKAVDVSKIPAIKEASAAAFDPKVPVMAKIALDSFYDVP